MEWRGGKQQQAGGINSWRWEWRNEVGDTLLVVYSPYSSTMRSGSTLGNFYTIYLIKKGENVLRAAMEKTIKGDKAEEATKRYLARTFGVATELRSHNHSMRWV